MKLFNKQLIKDYDIGYPNAVEYSVDLKRVVETLQTPYYKKKTSKSETKCLLEIGIT